MARATAAKAHEAAEALLDWLGKRREPKGPGLPAAAEAAAVRDDQVESRNEHREAARGGETGASFRLPTLLADPDHGSGPVPMILANTDWLHHWLTVQGPAADLAGFRAAAAGAGIIPWQLDFERLQEDWFHLLMDPEHRTLSGAGARILAGQLREAAERRHARAVARVGSSNACPFDLHALLPVPDEVLCLGPDHPRALGWLWQHWGTTQVLRHVAEEGISEQQGRARARNGKVAPAEPEQRDGTMPVLRLSFWSADWTPWRALAQLSESWPTLRFEVLPTYGVD